MYSARRGTPDVQQLLEGHDPRPLAEQRADVLERVEVADRLVVVGVLAQLLDAAMEVAEHRVEVDDLLAVELEDDPEHAVGRGVLGPHVDEHLAVAERVELGLALGPRRVRRDRLEDAEVAVERDARVVAGTLGRRVVVGAGVAIGARRRRGHAGILGAGLRQVPAAADRGGRRGIARGVGLLHRPDTGARGAGGVVGQVEVLAQREALVVGRHVDPAQVAVALERDAEHVVGLALHPLGALPQERDRGHPGVVARQPVGDDAQPVRRRLAPQVVHDLHVPAGVDAAQVGEELEPERRLVVQRGQQLGHVAGRDADLGLVVPLADGAGQLRGETALEPGLERAIHAPRPPRARSGRSPGPASGRGGP